MEKRTFKAGDRITYLGKIGTVADVWVLKQSIYYVIRFDHDGGKVFTSAILMEIQPAPDTEKRAA